MSFWLGVLGCYLAAVLSVNIGEYHNAFTDSQGLLLEPEIDSFSLAQSAMTVCVYPLDMGKSFDLVMPQLLL